MAFFDFLKRFKNSSDADVKRAANKRIVQLLDMEADESDEWQQLVEKRMNSPIRKNLKEATDGGTVIVNTRNEGMGWEILGSAYKGHIGQDQQVMIAQARRFFRFDPNAQAAVFGIVAYLMGKGVTITPKSKDPRIWKLWRKFWTSPENQMGIRQFEIVKRWIRDGEVMLRYFNTNDSEQAVPFVTVRFIDPIDVRRGANESNDETDKTSQGIVFDPDDAEKPITYYMRKRINPAEEDAIPAEQVQHIKFPSADMDQTRGESSLQTVMDYFTHYKQWLKNRIILNKLRTAIFAVREIDVASGANVSSLAQSLPSSGRQGDGESKKQNIRPGTLYSPPPGVKMRMESANINASDVSEDGRNMVLQMAAGTGLPEYMFGDASNANYSSTMMAESPFVKRIHFFQSYLEETLWRPMFRRVVEAAVKAEKIKAPEEEDIFADDGGGDLTEADKAAKKADGGAADEQGDEPISESELEIFYGCDVEWPEIIHRDPKEQTEALVLARNEGWVSDKTCSEKLGFEYAEEVRKQQQIMSEAEGSGNPLLDQRAGDQAAADEEAAGVDQQDKEVKGAKPGKNGAAAK